VSAQSSEEPGAESEPAPRRLVVARHARTEPSGETDALRELTQQGWEDAVAGGRWLAGRDVTPDGALVSSARRARSTWAALAEGGAFEVTPTYSESLYAAGPETALDLVRETDSDVSTLVVVGHNPTMAYLAQLLDDGSGDPDAVRQMATGFPPGTLAVFEIRSAWAALDLASARLSAFHSDRA
jgi:phosphohistidine phosphatase